jgi:hypothetical protein
MELARRPLILCIAVFSIALFGCQQTDPIGNGTDVPEVTCIDHDGDSYGVGCEAGFDCDDSDSTIWSDCDPGNPCSVPRAGCECDEEGEVIECRTSTPVESPDGSVLCYAGVRTCEGGIWTSCGSLYAYRPGDETASSDSGDPRAMDSAGVHREAVLGYPRTCVASCDSGCRHIYDCPSDMDYSVDTALNIRYDIIESSAATIIDNDYLEGFFFRTFGMTCTADTMATWWALDFDLEFLDVDGDGVLDGNPLIDIEVRPARTSDELLPVTDDTGWISVVRCPDTRADAACAHPVNPHDRVFAGGNLHDTLGEELARYQWLQMRVRLRRDVITDPSPRLIHTDVYFYCGDAS